MRIFPLFLCLILSLSLTGQTSMQEDVALARKYFELNDYSNARTTYLKIEAQHTLLKNDQRNLAICYQNLSENDQAIFRNLQLIKDNDYENGDLLRLANLLKEEARYDESLEILNIYRERGGVNARYHINSCAFAKEVLVSAKNCDLENFASNTSSTEYGMTFHDGDLVYASQKRELNNEFGIKGLSDNRADAVLYKVDDAEANSPKTLRKQSNEKNTFGFVSYAANGKLMVFVKSAFDENQSLVNGTNNSMGLFYAESSPEGNWSNDIPFPFNSDDYANGFPYLSEDGKSMFYASDMPGGKGGFDLYISNYANGSWSKPVNLGEDINTEGNEITPFLTDGTLYFASDYLPGLGGYDVYSIKKVEDAWAELSHLGACVNSPSDDFGFVIDPANESAYFSSTREGGKGHEDIYKIRDAKTIGEIELVSNEVVGLPKIDFSIYEKDNQQDVALMVPKTAKVTTSASDLTVVGDNDFLEIAKIESDLNADLFKIVIQEDDAIKNVTLEAGEKVYFVQIAALSVYKSDLETRFGHFKKYGNVYSVASGNMIKIRIGYFHNQEDAISVLKDIKRKGLNAFIIGDRLDVSRLNLIASTLDENIPLESKKVGLVPSYNSAYKIRVAAYKAPSTFHTGDVSDLGHIEHWTKGEWKIIILSGYATEDHAKKVYKKLIARGFGDAYVVKDVNGTLEKVQ